MRKIKLLLSVLLATTIFATAFTGCGTNENPDNPGVDKDGGLVGKYSTVWTMPSTAKVLKTDKVAENAKSELKIALAGGEAESAQIIMTANDGVEISSYEVKTNDLKSGNDVLSASNIEVYVEKYVRVRAHSNEIYPTGWYPDAIVPYEYAKTANELSFNSEAKADSQGLWITVNAPRGQKAGVYTGTIDLVVEEESFKVPVSVEVFNFDINEEIHAKTAFAIWEDRGMIESGYNVKPGSQEKKDIIKKEYDFLASKKIAPTNIPTSEYTQGSAESFAEAAKIYGARPEISAFRIPLALSTRSVSKEKVSEMLVPYIRALANASMEGGKVVNDLVKKAYCYFPEIDEPHPSTYPNEDIYAEVGEINNGFLLARKKVFDEFNGAKYNGVEGIEGLRNSIAGLQHVVTADRRNGLDGKVQTFCSLINFYDGRDYLDAQLKHRENDGEGMWWYTCVNPKAPFPSYHIDDSLLGARAMGWMQKDYSIEGNLYWCTNIYRKFTGGTAYEDRDIWNDPLAFAPTNGDGFITYPGAKYGKMEPIGTIRLDAVRDAQEDYEYLYMLDELVAKANAENGTDVSLNALLRDMYDSIYTGVQANDDLYAILNARLQVAELIEALVNDNAIINVLPYSANEDKFNVEVVAKSANDVKVNGTKAVKNGNVWKASTVDSVIKVEIDGNLYTRTMGGQYNAITSIETLDNVKQGDFKAELSSKAMDGANSLKLTSEATGGNAKAEITFDEINLTSAKKVVVYIYNGGTSVVEPKVALYDAKGKTSVSNSGIGYLYPGKWGKVEIKANATRLVDISKINKIAVSANATSSLELYVDNIFYFN